MPSRGSREETPAESRKGVEAPDRAPMLVASIVSFMPTPYEQFLYRELAGLVRKGVDLHVLATRGGQPTPPSPDVDLLVARTMYPAATISRLAWGLAWGFATRPRRMLGVLATVLVGHGFAPRNVALAFFSFAAGVSTARLLSGLGCQIVFGEWANHPATVAFVAARLLGTRFGFKSHAGDLFRHADPFLPGKASRAEFIATCTAEGAARLSDLAPGTPIHVVHHGLTDDWFAERSRALRAEPAILLVGRLDGSKGEDTLLRALAMLGQRGRRFSATFIGAGTGLEAARSLARDLGLASQVAFKGALPPEAVRAAYDDHDIFVLPARKERHNGIPNVLVEAMARRLVCIASPLPSLVELMRDGVNGWLVPQDDPAAIVRCLEWYLEARPETREAMGAAAHALVSERFRVAGTVAALEALLAGAEEGTVKFSAPRYGRPR